MKMTNKQFKARLKNAQSLATLEAVLTEFLNSIESPHLRIYAIGEFKREFLARYSPIVPQDRLRKAGGVRA